MFGSHRSADAIEGSGAGRVASLGALHPRRSAAAERHDPPLLVRRFVIEQALGLDELLAEAQRRLADTEASAQRAFWHGGLHVNGRPLDADEPPARIAAGSWVVAYAFAR